MTQDDVRKAIIALVAAGLVVAASLGIKVADHTQALIIGLVTAVAAYLAPALSKFDAKYSSTLAAVFGAALTGLQLLFTVVWHPAPGLQAAITGLVAAIAALFVPAVAHPTTAGQ